MKTRRKFYFRVTCHVMHITSLLSQQRHATSAWNFLCKLRDYFHQILPLRLFTHHVESLGAVLRYGIGDSPLSSPVTSRTLMSRQSFRNLMIIYD